MAKNKMQTVDFKSMEEFLDYLPADERAIVMLLQQLIYQSIPNVTEKLSYNVPYYKRNKNICFIWPASILWGKTKSYTGVRLGFTAAYLLSDELNYLDRSAKKQVGYHDFKTAQEVDVDVVKAYLYQAYQVDSSFKFNKKVAKQL